MSMMPVLYSFARSGGTLVNQLLGVHPDCLVLSEVNPAASFKSVGEQAVEWLGLATAAEAEFLAMPYREQIRALSDRAMRSNKCLVIRDWVTVNFLPRAAPHVTPSGELEQQLYLESAGFEAIGLVVTRRASAVYKSIVRNFTHVHDLAPATFAAAYVAYARAVCGMPRVHMEALRATPESAVREILERFSLDASGVQTLLATFASFRKCTGNTTLRVSNESADANRILPPEAMPEVPADIAAALDEADGLLGYA